MMRFDQSTESRPAGPPADLTLRFGTERLRGRVHWPEESAASALVFGLGEAGDTFGASLSSAAGAVVVWFASPRDASVAAAALGWAAEHVCDLGGDPTALVVAGVDLGGACAARLALGARDHGWPDLRRQLLIHPMFDKAWAVPTDGAGLAPATVVTTTPPEATASRYVADLRAAGVDVDELQVPYRGLPRGTELDALVHCLRLENTRLRELCRPTSINRKREEGESAHLPLGDHPPAGPPATGSPIPAPPSGPPSTAGQPIAPGHTNTRRSTP